ncbi:propionyl-coenzyme A carboxylase alpha polypeptide [Mesorhizobium sp. M7A.F.Ca.US.008.03.1.1]|nr:propionyl-coenzyme A carboxylase alpha polypeptide [Mesorhizobium sp. M7A.F.Ca.US.008.03.1.1]
MHGRSSSLHRSAGQHPPSALPGISPSRGEIGCHECFRRSPELQEKALPPKLPISPLEGEMSGRIEGGAKE